MKRVYIIGSEVHICTPEELELSAYNFKARTVTDHPIIPAGTLVRIPRGGVTSFDIEDDEVGAVQARIDCWKKPLVEVKEVEIPSEIPCLKDDAPPAKPAVKQPVKQPAKAKTTTSRIGGK